MSENDNHKSGFESMRAQHEARHRRERELAEQGVDYIAQSRRGGMGQLLDSLSEDHSLNVRKRAALEGRIRRGDELKRELLPELDLLLWDRRGDYISPREAYTIYLTRWPFLEEERLTKHESRVIDILLQVFRGANSGLPATDRRRSALAKPCFACSRTGLHSWWAHHSHLRRRPPIGVKPLTPS